MHGPDIQLEGIRWQVTGHPPEGDADPQEGKKTVPFQNYHQARDYAIAKLDIDPPDYPNAVALEGDFWGYLGNEAKIPKQKAAALIVDPYWDKALWKTDDPNKNLLQRIAEFALWAVEPDGYVVVMIGQQHLPDAINELLKDGNLIWHWLGVYYQKGSGTQFHAGGMQSRNKPLLIFKLKGSKLNGMRAVYKRVDTVADQQ